MTKKITVFLMSLMMGLFALGQTEAASSENAFLNQAATFYLTNVVSFQVNLSTISYDLNKNRSPINSCAFDECLLNDENSQYVPISLYALENVHYSPAYQYDRMKYRENDEFDDPSVGKVFLNLMGLAGNILIQ